MTPFVTDACKVEICVVLKHQTDIEDESSLMMGQKDVHKMVAGGVGVASSRQENSLGTLVISNCVQLTIHPQDTTLRGFNVFQ